MRTESGPKYVLLAMQPEETQNGRSDPYAEGTAEKSSVHKCQNLAILDWSLLSAQAPLSCLAAMIHQEAASLYPFIITIDLAQIHYVIRLFALVSCP